MLKRIRNDIDNIRKTAGCYWEDDGRDAALESLTQEKERLEPIVENLEKIGKDFEGYSGDISGLIGSYETTMQDIVDLGYFGEGTLDSMGLFEGSKECLQQINTAITNIVEQAAKDLKTNQDLLDDVLEKIADYEQNPHKGEKEVCPSVGSQNNNNNPGGCFLAGTKVLTNKGLVNIEDINSNDLVLTYNVENNVYEYSKVIEPLVHDDDIEDVYEITINDETIFTTAIHPFYIEKTQFVDLNDISVNHKDHDENHVWIAAKNLKVGYNIVTSLGKYYEITNIKHYSHKGVVYNLNVERNHNYFVSEKAVLVHNAKAMIA